MHNTLASKTSLLNGYLRLTLIIITKLIIDCVYALMHRLCGHPGGGDPRELPLICTKTFTNPPLPKTKIV